MFKKKGLEPLIATILLIVVAVILVTIVLAWGKNFSTEGLNKTSTLLEDTCSAATINLSNCDYNSLADGAELRFYIKNTSNSYTFDANNFKINIIDDSNQLNSEMNEDLETEQIDSGATIIATYDTEINATTRVKVQIRSNTCPGIAFGEITCS